MSTLNTFFKIATVIILGVVIAVTIANVIHYARVNPRQCTDVSTGQKTIMLILNIILMLLALGLFIWSIFLLFRREVRTDILRNVTVTQARAAEPVTRTRSRYY